MKKSMMTATIAIAALTGAASANAMAPKTAQYVC